MMKILLLLILIGVGGFLVFDNLFSDREDELSSDELILENNRERFLELKDDRADRKEEQGKEQEEGQPETEPGRETDSASDVSREEAEEETSDSTGETEDGGDGEQSPYGQSDKIDEGLQEQSGTQSGADEQPDTTGETSSILLVLLGEEKVIERMALFRLHPEQEGGERGEVIEVAGEKAAYLPGGDSERLGLVKDIYRRGESDEAHRWLLLQNVARLTGIGPLYYVEICREGMKEFVESSGFLDHGEDGDEVTEELSEMKDNLDKDIGQVNLQDSASLLSAIREEKGYGELLALYQEGMSHVETNLSLAEIYELYCSLQ